MLKKNDVAVLDIGSEKITAFIGSRISGEVYSVKGLSEIPYDGYDSGEFFTPDELKRVVAKALKDAEEQASTRINKVYVGVPADFSTVKVKQINKDFKRNKIIEDADIEQIFVDGDTFQGTNYHTINASPIYYTLDKNSKRFVDVVGLPANAVSACVSYVLCEKPFIHLFDSIASVLGYEFEYVSAPLGEALTMTTADTRDKGALILDIGHISSFILYARGEGILYMKSISVGGDFIAGDLNQVLGISYAQAQKLKEKINFNLIREENSKYEITLNDRVFSFDASSVNDIAEARVEEIGDIILKALDDCVYDIPKHLPIMLTGGGLSYNTGSAEYLSRLLSRPVSVYSPQVPRLNSPCFTSLIWLVEIADKREAASAPAVTFIKKIVSLFSKRKED